MSLATERLLKNARVSLPGSLDDAILLEFFNVMDKFFRESSIWTEDVPFYVVGSDPAGTTYYIEPESVSSIVRLMGVVDVGGFRQRAAMSIPGEVTLLTPPSQEGTMLASVALSIVDPVQRDGYPEFPEWILEKYGLGILSGLMGRMMAQPAKPYTNMQLATAHLAAYQRSISVAGTESLHRNVNNAQAWVFPQSFATRSRRR